MACKIGKDLLHEANILKSLDHENVWKFIKFEEYLDENGNQKLYTEFVKHGELLHVLQRVGPLPEKVARYFLVQILSGLNYLHNTAKICHRDLKLENVVLQENYTIKIIDFGFATDLVKTDG